MPAPALVLPNGFGRIWVICLILPKFLRSRDQILQAVWNTDYFGDGRTVDTHVKNLRMKLGPCGEMVRTVRSRGYLLDWKQP